MKHHRSAFTLLELLIASSLTVMVVIFTSTAVQSILERQKQTNEKPRLALESYVILEQIEKALQNKCFSQGNLLYQGSCYPFEYKCINEGTNLKYGPSLSFFTHTPQGPTAVTYTLGPLPEILNPGESANYGLYSMQLPTEESRKLIDDFSLNDHLYTAFPEDKVIHLSHLLSENIVLFEVQGFNYQDGKLQILKTDEDGNFTDVGMLIFQGKVVLGNGAILSAHQLDGLQVTVGALSKREQGKFFALPETDREAFLEKKGILMSRIIPWTP